MKITHCIASIDKSTGGPARSVTQIVSELSKLEEISKISILTLYSDFPLMSTGSNSKTEIYFHKFQFFKFSTELNNSLQNVDVDLFHGHGLWNLSVHQMAKNARVRAIPYLISIRGMLESWSLTQSTLKKKTALWLYQHTDIKKAKCLHATSLMEVESIRNLGYTNPIAFIPNGIRTGHYPLKDFTVKKEKKKILFLSRIHLKKGIELLINCWAKINPSFREDWIIEIAGNGEESYVKQLSKLIEKNNLQNQITIVGPQFGQAKIDMYHSADLFVLPSYSENFGIVIAEALCCGIPVITTKGTPWQEIEEVNAGKWIENEEQSLERALKELILKSDAERELMGRNGRKLIIENYSITAVAEKMALLYKWILKKVEKPDFVHIYND